MQMEAQKSRIDELENALTHSKILYKEAMNNLSKISEEVGKQLIYTNFKRHKLLFVKKNYKFKDSLETKLGKVKF